jgi:chromosome segregation ATPase
LSDELAERQRETAAELEAMTTTAEGYRNELSAAKDKLQAQAAAMRDLESSVARQRDAGAITASSLQQSLQQAKSEATQLQEKNAQLAQELEKLQRQCERLQQASAELEAALSENRRTAQRAEAELTAARDRYKQQFETAAGEHRSAMQRTASLEERMTGLLQVISKHSKERQKIMDNAFTSAIRLCVIAPTVTVEVDDLSVRVGPTVNEVCALSG